MKVVYLCAPYRSDTEYGVHCNIQNADRLAAKIWKMGAVCLCPHKNTAYFGGVIPDKDFLDGAIELLRRCDAVFVHRPNIVTEGMQGELDVAVKVGIQVFSRSGALNEWLIEQAKEKT